MDKNESHVVRRDGEVVGVYVSKDDALKWGFLVQLAISVGRPDPAAQEALHQLALLFSRCGDP